MKSLLIIFTFLSLNVNAQSDNTASIFSQFYFPFDFGYAISLQKNMNTGSLVKTGLEYRFKKNNGLFIRLNYNNRSNQFSHFL